MKNDIVSLRRRHLLIAGLAAMAAPAVAGLPAGGSGGEAMLVVSGRMVGPDGTPIADAAIEAWQAGESSVRARATTDADGRFMFTTHARAGHDGRPAAISYRISHEGHGVRQTSVDFASTPDARAAGAQLQRDETGTWRAAVGLAFA